jgi:hypothetical protein
MPPETIDTDAERGVIAQLVGRDRPQALAVLYAKLRIEPERVDRAIGELEALHLIESYPDGLALSPGMFRLDRLDLLHL